MNYSAATVLIKQFEGFRSHPYIDPVGLPTIGYGSRYFKGVAVSMAMPEITEEQAAEQLEKDISAFALKILPLLSISLTEGKMNAVVAFVYNIGITAFEHSSLLRAINSGASDDTITADWQEWNKGTVGRGSQTVHVVLPGLVTRRAAEVALYSHDGDNSTSDDSAEPA